MNRQLDNGKTSSNLLNGSGKSFVSVIVPMRNEEKHIERCLNSIISQDFLPNHLEILVVDGLSEDKSPQIVRELAEKVPAIRLLTNPSRTTAIGLNLGIKASKGSVIIILSAHSQASPSFVSRSVEFLEKTGDDCVGGLMEARGKGYLGETISMVLSSPFGIGGARFRYSRKPQHVDTVAYGAYRREVFDKIGLFDDRLVRNQDIEFNSRLRKAGGKIYLTPEIKIYYYCPETIRRFCQQAFSNGLWNIKTIRLVKGTLSYRHFVPLIFVLALLASLLLAIFTTAGGYLLLGIMVSYAISSLAFSVATACRKGWRFFFVLPFLFLCLHISYGVGSLWGIVERRAGVSKGDG